MNWLFGFAVLLNIVSSVGIIIVNKIIFLDIGWKFATSLTSVHFLCNYLACELFVYLDQQRNKLKRNRLLIKDAVPMAMCWAGSIVFANLSLLANTTGFYQASKLLDAPVLIAWQWVFFGVSTDVREMLSLVPLICGICLITVSEINLKAPSGLFYAGGQLLAAAAVQTWVKSKQINQRISATELLLGNSLICFVITIPVAPFVDYTIVKRWIWEVPLTELQIATILTSAMLALGINLSCFLIIGYSDPLTFTVVGYLKTLLVFIGGAYIFDEGWKPKKLIGIGITIFGLIIYRWVKWQIAREEGGEIAVMVRKWTNSRSRGRKTPKTRLDKSRISGKDGSKDLKETTPLIANEGGEKTNDSTQQRHLYSVECTMSDHPRKTSRRSRGSSWNGDDEDLGNGIYFQISHGNSIACSPIPN